MDPSDEMRVPASRGKSMLVLLGSLIFVAAAIALLLLPPARTQTEQAGRAVSAIFGICFFGMAVAFAAYKAFDPRPAIVLTSEKLVNRSSALQIQEVFWSEVAYAEIVPFLNQRFLILHLNDPEAVFARQNPAVQKVQGANMALVGSPVAIAGSIISCSLDELLAECERRVHRSRQPPNG